MEQDAELNSEAEGEVDRQREERAYANVRIRVLDTKLADLQTMVCVEREAKEAALERLKEVEEQLNRSVGRIAKLEIRMEAERRRANKLQEIFKARGKREQKG